MKKKIKINFALNTTVNVLNTLISFFATGYLARVLGPNNIGLYSYLVSIVSYFTLFGSIGTAKYASREIAYKRDDREEMSRVFEEVFLLRLMLCSLSLLLYLLMMHFSDFDSRIVFVFSFFIVNEVVDISWFCHGIENFRVIFISTFIMRLVFLFSILTFVRTNSDFMSYICIEVGYLLIFNALLWFSLRGRIKLVGKLHPFRHLKESFLLFLPSIAIQIYVVLDKTMLGFFSSGNYEQNSYYSLAEGIVKAFLLIGTSLTKVTAPRIAHLNANDRKDEIYETLYESYRLGWFVTIPISIFIFISSDYIVPLYFGPGYDGVIILMKILSPLVLLITFSGITGEQYLIPCKFTNTQTAILFGGAAVNLVMNLILILRFFAVGASVATIMAETFVTVVQLIVVERIGELRIGRILKEGKNYILSSILLIVFYAFTTTIMDVSLVSYIVNMVGGFVIYFGTLALMKDRFVSVVFHRA